ncbi:MAG: hypothetical protein ABTQ31_08885 [Rhizobiaceae bacterium]
MRLLIAAAFALCALPATAAELSSQYTRNNVDRDCKTLARSPADEGFWVDIRCPGVAGYTYMIRDSDGRQSVTYGSSERSSMPTFGAFNYGHPTVEWRMGKLKGKTVPVAAIQRFSLADGDGKWTTQILVVSKVVQRGSSGCILGYVSANEGASANERARALSNRATAFHCGRDKPTVEAKIREHVPRW